MTTKLGLQHYINHVSLVVDRSGSMGGQPVVRVFDEGAWGVTASGPFVYG